MTVERHDPPPDYQQRGLWLGLASAVVIAFGGGSLGGFFGGGDLQVWFFVANRVALAISLLLCLLLVIPDLRARLGTTFAPNQPCSVARLPSSSPHC